MHVCVTRSQCVNLRWILISEINVTNTTVLKLFLAGINFSHGFLFADDKTPSQSETLSENDRPLAVMLTEDVLIQETPRAYSFINPPWPSDTHMCQWTMPSLFHKMASCLFSTRPLSKAILTYCQTNLQEKIQWNFNRKSDIFLEKNALKNVVCKP